MFGAALATQIHNVLLRHTRSIEHILKADLCVVGLLRAALHRSLVHIYVARYYVPSSAAFAIVALL